MMEEEILPFIPRYRIEDVVYVDLMPTESPIGLAPLELPAPLPIFPHDPDPPRLRLLAARRPPIPPEHGPSYPRAGTPVPGPEADDQATASHRLGSGPLGGDLEDLVPVAGSPPPRSPRDRCGLAPATISPVLDAEEPAYANGSTFGSCGDPPTDPQAGPGQLPLGSPEDPRRIAEARHRDQPSHGSEVHAPSLQFGLRSASSTLIPHHADYGASPHARPMEFLEGTGVSSDHSRQIRAPLGGMSSRTTSPRMGRCTHVSLTSPSVAASTASR